MKLMNQRTDPATLDDTSELEVAYVSAVGTEIWSIASIRLLPPESDSVHSVETTRRPHIHQPERCTTDVCHVVIISSAPA